MKTLSGGIAMLMVFSFFQMSAAGGTFGVVPFVSQRSLGIVAGMTGAGGNAGSAITQALFFTSGSISSDLGFVYMGIMICCASSVILLVWFPQWGGMIFGPSKKVSATEEEYYSSEYSEKEREGMMHSVSLKVRYQLKASWAVYGVERVFIQSQCRIASLLDLLI